MTMLARRSTHPTLVPRIATLSPVTRIAAPVVSVTGRDRAAGRAAYYRTEQKRRAQGLKVALITTSLAPVVAALACTLVYLAGSYRSLTAVTASVVVWAPIVTVLALAAGVALIVRSVRLVNEAERSFDEWYDREHTA